MPRLGPHFASIDRCLGPSNRRFFGGGFKRVNHLLTRFAIADEPGLGAAGATAALLYPEDWSLKSSGNPPPHLSSVDVVAIMVELVDAYLTHSYGLDSAQRRRSELHSYDMRVRSPQEDLDCFDVNAACSSCQPIADLQGRFESTFDCTIGTVRARCSVAHEAKRLRTASGSYATSAEILGEGSRFYSQGYKQRTHQIQDLRLAGDLQSLTAAVTVSGSRWADGDLTGFGAALAPYVSTIDCLLVLAQLGQVLAYQLDGVERARSNTFWMRRLAVRTSRAFEPIGTPGAAAVEVIRSGLLTMGEQRWRTFDLRGRLMGVEIESAVAHQLPDVVERDRGSCSRTSRAPAVAPGILR